MHKTSRKFQEEKKKKKPQHLTCTSQAILMKIPVIPFPEAVLLEGWEVQSGEHSQGRLMEPRWDNTEQEMLKACDAHICLFHYWALNVASSLPPELIFRSSRPDLLK